MIYIPNNLNPLSLLDQKQIQAFMKKENNCKYIPIATIYNNTVFYADLFI